MVHESPPHRIRITLSGSSLNCRAIKISEHGAIRIKVVDQCDAGAGTAGLTLAASKKGCLLRIVATRTFGNDRGDRRQFRHHRQFLILPSRIERITSGFAQIDRESASCDAALDLSGCG